MSSHPIVALLGPPGSGKSTVSAALSARSDLHVFRLRDVSRAQARRDPLIAKAIEDTRDPLGWLSDPIALLLLRRALQDPRTALTPVLLEGYPGTAAQARSLARCTALAGRRLSVIELSVSPATTARRIEARRVCPACDTSQGGPRKLTDTPGTGGAENLMPRPRRFPYTRHKPRATGRNTARFVTSEGSRPCVTAPLSSFPRHGTR